jgi:hypothetical protein
MSGERVSASVLMHHIPARCPYLWYVIRVHYRAVSVMEEFMIEVKRLLRGGICAWRSAVFDLAPLGIDLGTSSCSTSWPRIATSLLMLRLLLSARTHVFLVWALPTYSLEALQRGAAT